MAPPSWHPARRRAAAARTGSNPDSRRHAGKAMRQVFQGNGICRDGATIGAAMIQRMGGTGDAFHRIAHHVLLGRTQRGIAARFNAEMPARAQKSRMLAGAIIMQRRRLLATFRKRYENGLLVMASASRIRAPKHRARRGPAYRPPSPHAAARPECEAHAMASSSLPKP